jgi:plasmid stability protein
MSSIIVRNIEARLKAQLRVRAARHDRSMEEEVRVILRNAVAGGEETSTSLASAITARFEPLGGVELELPPRAPMRKPPKLR